jgi:UDP-glucose:(heptosyl)LPS alpha-1,3-glucosyltransferase
MVRDEIQQRFSVPDAKLHVIPNSVDGDVFHPGLRSERTTIASRHGIDAESTIFLLAATDFARADLGTTIDAFAQLPPPAHLIAVGDDNAPARYLARARARGVGDRVTLVPGDVDRRPYYGAADAFVLPSLYDPSPDVALEAMACALPVITSTKSGAASLLQECDGGLVCPSGDVAALAAHMRLSQDTATRARLAGNARRAVLPFSPSAITLQQVLLYRDLLAKPVPPVLDTASAVAAAPDRSGG